MTVCTELDRAVERLQGGEAEVTVDFTDVPRVDGGIIRALEELADLAESKGARVTLQGVRLDVYKVLKLLKLARRFGFVEVPGSPQRR